MIVYMIYGGEEVAHVMYLGEESLVEEHFKELVEKNFTDIFRKDGKLKSPKTIAESFTRYCEILSIISGD